MPLLLSARRLASRRAITLAVAAALTLTATEALGAQQREQLRVGVPDQKSVTTGVLLSGLVFPGLGSFYAGNAQHGWIHTGVTVAAIVGTLAASGSCRRSCPNEDGIVILGLSTLVVNDIWSMFTAARDVAAANAARAKSP